MLLAFFWVLLAAIMLGFYAFPSKYVKGYGVENLWGSFWLFAMIIVPVLASFILVNGLGETFAQVPSSVFVGIFFLSMLWGIGNLLWGISISKIGMALGFSLLIGVATLVGSMLPFFMGNLDQLNTTAGRVIVLGIFIIMGGIVLNGKAGLLREANADTASDTSSSKHMKTGIIMCIVGGICAAGFNLSYHVADTIGQIGRISQEQFGNEPWIARLAVMLPSFIGSGVVTVLYFAYKLNQSKSWHKFASPSSRKNILLIVVMALVYVASLLIYGLGAYSLGALGTSVGFAVFQTGCIMIANILGLFSGEWTNAGKRSKYFLYSGLLVMTLGITVIAYGNFISY
ncbi:L-rhamnose-proton symport protein (RhaT) [Zobellia uliginosa]|uniref:L-rhamnose-proton symport protein (RhaT) n=1 Tax=Zobellia uliginosa TaxID=143224 RepID=A0ABY1L0J7_9FLAO|nr:L-rhamnose/proton symporter RhaT [Zobellia uliginosa]SIT02395.1 L-rhamnose-proton symport protein (RhaT) [Zobellia uliginosa]